MNPSEQARKDAIEAERLAAVELERLAAQVHSRVQDVYDTVDHIVALMIRDGDMVAGLRRVPDLIFGVACLQELVRKYIAAGGKG